MTPKPTKFGVELTNELIKVFFYGTLKRNEPNYHHLLNRNVKFVAKAITVDKWPLIIGTNANIPFLLNKKNYGKNVYGEIYLVDREAKNFLDDFEGIHDDFYSCEKIQVRELPASAAEATSTSVAPPAEAAAADDSANLHDVFVYMLNNFDEKSLLNEKQILFENYSSKNPYFPEYQSNIDRPDNTANLVNQVKTAVATTGVENNNRNNNNSNDRNDRND